MTKKINVLPVVRNVKHGAGTVQTTQFPRKDYGCQPWLMLRSVTHSWAPSTLPDRSADLCREGPYKEWWLIALCRNFFPLGANGKTLKFRFFVIRLYYAKYGHILNPLVPKFRPDLSARLTRGELGSPANLRWLGGGGRISPPVLLPNHDAVRKARGGNRKLSRRGI